MSRWKRVGLSFASAVIADILFGLAFLIGGNPGHRIEQLFGFLYFSSVLVIPGWLIALPILVLPRNAIRMRYWQLGLIGTAIGPAIMIAIGVYAAIASGTGLNYKREAFNLLYLATGISFLTTVLYLSTLRLSARHSIQPTT
jgi:hypothetical protein